MTYHPANRGSAALLGAALLILFSACSSDPEPSSPAPPAPSLISPSTGVSSPKAGTEPPPPPPPANTPVPPATPGGIDSTVPTAPERSQPPVDLDDPSRTGQGTTVRLSKIQSIRAKAELPGEVAGPALALTVKVTNDSREAVDLNSTVVTLTGSDQAPGIEMTAAPAKRLDGKLAPGASRQGVYVFAVPPSKREPIMVAVTLAGAPVLVFTGDAG